MTRVLRADQAGPRVVPGLVADAQGQAAALLARAEHRAHAIAARAEDMIAAQTAEAERLGYERGQTRASAELASALEALENAREQLLAKTEPQVVELAMAAAQHIVAAELALQPDAIARIVQPLLDRMRRAQTVTVHLHPEDAVWFRGALPGLQSRPGLAIEANVDLTRGSCIVTSEIGALDARLETRLNVLADALKRTSRPDLR